MAAKRLGRPPKPSSQVRSLVYPVRLTRTEWRELQKLAQASGEPPSELMRLGGLERGRRLSKRRKE